MLTAPTTPWTEPAKVSASRTVADLAIVVVLLAVGIGIRASSPSNTYAYAQLWQIGVAIDVGENGDWLTPHDQKGAAARKPQLLPWLTGPTLKLLGIYNDFTFRLPSIASALLTGVLIYCLGRRWFNRSVGLIAGCLWATALHMGRLSYLATTDMLLTLWITAAVACVDRVLWHQAARRRWLWLVGFYTAMVLAALSKGWGVVNWPVLALMVAIATALRPGFAELGSLAGPRKKINRAIRLVAQRWWAAVRGTQLWWGVLAFVIVLGGLLVAMNARAGNELSAVFGFEVIRRIIGGGESPPRPTSVPPILQMVYYALPMSILALGAFRLDQPRGLFSERSWLAGLIVAVAVGSMAVALWLMACEPAMARMASPVLLFVGAVMLVTGLSGWCYRENALSLPMCWLLAVVIPFSLAYGFRADYLLPCYAAVAVMAAWAVDRVASLGAAGGRRVSVLRHVFAAAPVAIALTLIVLPVLYMLGNSLPEWVRLEQPYRVSPADRAVLVGLIPAGAAMLVAAVVLSLKWKVRQFILLACVGMLGVMFIEGNFITRHARRGDGDKMVAFARKVKEVVGKDDFLVLMGEKLTVELYLGRFGQVVVPLQGVSRLEQLNNSRQPWLITTDRGLVELGAAVPSLDGDYLVDIGGAKRRFAVRPEDVGQVAVVGQAVCENNWGRMYLIRLSRPITVGGEPMDTGYITGDWDEED